MKNYKARVSMVFELPFPIEGENSRQASDWVANLVNAMDDYELLDLLNGCKMTIDLTEVE